jgi:hypothetical protein
VGLAPVARVSSRVIDKARESTIPGLFSDS